MVERDAPDGRMQKLMGKPWSSWNLPEQPTEHDLRKLRETYMPPDQYRVHHQSTPLPPRYISLFGTHPDSDFLSITKCPACGWLMKIQHANKHFLKDSRGAIVCKDSDLAIFGNKVLGKACHPVGELTDSYSKKITLKVPPAHKSSSTLRGTSSINDYFSKSRSGSGSHTTNKTDYYSHSTSQYRSRSHSQLHIPSAAYMQKGRSGSSATSSSNTHGSISMNSSSSLSRSKSSKSHSNQSSSSSWSSLRSPPPPSKMSGSHKPSQSTAGSYTLSIPSEDMGQNESVEDLLMPNISSSHGNSKHTVHIIATSNSGNKSKSSDPDYDHIKFYSDVPEKRLKLDSHSRSTDHHRKTSDMHHDLYVSSKQLKHSSSSSYNGAGSSHTSISESSSKKSKSSSLSLSKNDSGSSNKHHLRSTAPSSIVSVSKPIVSSSHTSSSGQSRSHHHSSTSSSIQEKVKEKERSAPQKKKKRKRDKDEPRKIIPLKDRDFNPDKHCGVCAQGESAPCKRSLTCKTHSVAMRRAVVGRSQSFDALLAAHKLAKSEEKVSIIKPKEPVEEPPPQITPIAPIAPIAPVTPITPPKPKKKKPSGSNSINIGSSPNDLKPLAVVPEHTSSARAGSPDIEVIEVRTKPKTPKPMIPSTEFASPRNFKICPLVYPYTPNIQAKFEMVWYNPTTMDRVLRMTGEERHKFVFLLKHYKNPFFTNSEISLPLVKCCREKRNVFSNWNASEKPVEGTQQFNRAQDARRQDDDGGVQFIGVYAKK